MARRGQRSLIIQDDGLKSSHLTLLLAIPGPGWGAEPTPDWPAGGGGGTQALCCLSSLLRFFLPLKDIEM